MLAIFRNPFNLGGLISGLVHALVLCSFAVMGVRATMVEFATRGGGVSLTVRMEAAADSADESHWHVHGPSVPQDHQHAEHDSQAWVLHAHVTRIEKQPATVSIANLAGTSQPVEREPTVEPLELRRRQVERLPPEIATEIPPMTPRNAVTPEEFRLASPTTFDDVAGASVDTPPQSLPTNPAPPYPPESLRRGEQGVVILRIRIDASGRVEEVHMVQSSGFALLDRSVMDTLRVWRFSPARSGGINVPTTVDVPFRFRIRQ